MFENNTLLCRLVLRRDRLRTIIWLVGILALVVGFGSAIPGMYPSEAERLVMAETMKNPAMVVMLGPVYDSAGYTIGALYSNYMLLWSVVIMGIMNIFLVVRHTRQDEERGRIEVIRSLPVGRLSNLSAVLTTSVILNFAFALLIGVGLAVLGNESMDFAGSMLFGAAMGVTGLLFAAVTAIFCQLCANPRTAQSLSFAFLVIAYIVRGMGDMESELLACLSPLGLILRTKTYVENLWWPIFVMLGVSIAAAVLAFWLCGIRDMGEGIVPARPGKRDAAPYLKSAGGLAWRLLRTPFIIWALIVPILGMAYGSVMGDMESFISTNELFKMIFPDGDPAQFISFLMVIMSIICTIPILQFILKARSQESGGYAENVLARSASRHDQLRGYFLVALGAGALMPFLNAVGFWAGSYPVMENPIAFSVFFQASMIYIPAIWFMLGVAMLLIAYLPRLVSFVWAYLGYAFIIVYIGSAMKLPEWMAKLSPFGYIPQLPAEEFKAAGVVMLTTIATVMFVLGFIGYRQRDMKFS